MLASIHGTGQHGLTMRTQLQQLAFRYYQSLSGLIIVTLTTFTLFCHKHVVSCSASHHPYSKTNVPHLPD